MPPEYHCIPIDSKFTHSLLKRAHTWAWTPVSSSKRTAHTCHSASWATNCDPEPAFCHFPGGSWLGWWGRGGYSKRTHIHHRTPKSTYTPDYQHPPRSSSTSPTSSAAPTWSSGAACGDCCFCGPWSQRGWTLRLFARTQRHSCCAPAYFDRLSAWFSFIYSRLSVSPQMSNFFWRVLGWKKEVR